MKAKGDQEDLNIIARQNEARFLCWWSYILRKTIPKAVGSQRGRVGLNAGSGCTKEESQVTEELGVERVISKVRTPLSSP